MVELAEVISWLLAMFFAAVWGAHLYYAAVFFPAIAVDPPKSVLEWLATPYAMRVARFWRGLVPGLYTLSFIGIGLALALGLRMWVALAVAGLCGIIHMIVVMLIFLPINLKLGFDPGGPGASNLDPQTVERLVRKWGRWNFARIGLETAGLIAAVLAFKAS